MIYGFSAAMFKLKYTIFFQKRYDFWKNEALRYRFGKIFISKIVLLKKTSIFAG